jgi:tetratricopeptide (TPR) repeat protein
MLARFAEEMRLARRIAHPNVCRVFDMGEADGAPYVSMEYVAGEELKDVLRMTQGLSPGQTASIGKQVAAGLVEAHRVGVIHRDLKPQNIMIDREGTARIMDFGIARLSRADRDRSGRHVMIGTPDYMSPEQASGAEIDARSDLYSLGVILFEMATGRLPFEASTATAMAVKHKTEPPPDPRSVNPRIPEDLSRLILRLLEKDPTRRPQSAAEVRDELELIEKEAPATAPVLPPRTKSTARQITLAVPPLMKLAVPAAAIILVAAGVFLATRFLLHRGSSAAPRIPNSIAVIGFENQTGDPKYDHLRKAIPELITTNLENMGRFQVTTWERMQDVLRQAGRTDVAVIGREDGFEACRLEGVAEVVTGSFTKAGDTFMTNIKLLDAETRKLLKGASARGEGENSILRTQIDELSREIVRGLAGAGGAAQEKPAVPVMEATTGSMEAYTLFLKGRDQLSRIEVAAGVETLGRAVAIDPGFAIAHLWLGGGLATLGDPRSAAEHFRLARENAAKASEKERLLIEASLARRLDQDDARCVRLLSEFVKAYPREKGAWSELGHVLQQAGRLDEAAAALRKALDLDPFLGEALNALAYNAMDRTNYDEADSFLRKYMKIRPEDTNPIDSMAELDYVRGRPADAEAGYRRVVAADPGFVAQPKLAWMQVLQEKYVESLETFRSWRAAPGTIQVSQAGSRLAESVVLHLMGRNRESLRALQEARTLAGPAKITAAADLVEGWFEIDAGEWERAREAFRRMASSYTAEPSQQPLLSADPATQEGFALVAGGRADAAQVLWARVDESLRAREVNFFPVMVEMNDLLRARILAVRGDLDGARSLLARSRPFRSYLYQIFFMVAQSLPLERDDLARVLARQGRRDEAIEQYKILTGTGSGRGNRNPIPPIYHYRLAKLYEEAASPADARMEYERFLKVLKKADAESKETEDARKRISALEGKRP